MCDIYSLEFFRLYVKAGLKGYGVYNDFICGLAMSLYGTSCIL